MSASLALTPHDASPEVAIAAVCAFDGPLLLDLDETLYLRNSTEDFIDCAYPGAVAAVLMKVLEQIKPWRWTGGEETRHVWRARLVILLFPWTMWRWTQRLPGLTEKFANQSLIAALRARKSDPIIVTLGFQCIVTPLITALQFKDAQVVAPRLSSFKDRRRGKLDLARDALGEDVVRRGLVLTDSIDDLPLLDACATPLRTVWPDARYRSAFSDVYLPGHYIQRIKHPGERYITGGILQEDFLFWVLASISLSTRPFLHLSGLLFLLLSFWAIYERGYVDNDQIAARYETNPKLSGAFHDAPVAMPLWEPWIWALVAGAIAIVLLRWPVNPVPGDFAKWFSVLLATYLWFLFYNRIDKSTRVWIYPGLQLARSAAFVVLVPIAAIGAMALGAHVLARWLPYYIYRLGGEDWPEARVPLTRLLFFLVMGLMLAITQGVSELTTWTAAALLGWALS